MKNAKVINYFLQTIDVVNGYYLLVSEKVSEKAMLVASPYKS